MDSIASFPPVRYTPGIPSARRTLRMVSSEEQPDYDGDPVRPERQEQRGTFRMIPDCVGDLNNPHATHLYNRMLRLAKGSDRITISRKELAAFSGISEGTIEKLLPLFVEKGFIRIEKRANGGMKLPNCIVLLAHLIDEKCAEESDRHQMSNVRQEMSVDQTRPVDRKTPAVDHVKKQEYGNVNEKRNYPPTPQRRSTPQVAGPVNYTDDFMRLWNASLRKDKKLQAFRVWEEINPDKTLADQIVRAMETQVRANPRWREEGGRFCPMVDNWLINRRWEDTIDTTNPAEENPKLKGGMGLNLVRERKRLVIARAGCKLESELPRYDARISDVDTDLLALGVTVQEAEAWALRH